MLILSRRKGEDIHIGDDIVVSLVSINGNQARIGINAPKSIAIHREEVYRRVAQEKQQPTFQPGDKNELKLASVNNGENND